MAGTWIFNLVLGLFGFFIVFLFSLVANSFITALIRGMVALFLFYLAGFIFRWMFAYIKAERNENNHKLDLHSPNVGKNVNEMEHLFNSLSEEDTKKVVEYIRSIMRDEQK